MARYGEGFFKHMLLFMFTSSLVLHHFVNPKLTEIQWNIQFILYVIYFCFSAFGNIATDVPKPLDILASSGFFGCTSCTKQYFPSYILLWKRKTPHNRDLQNQLESVRDLLTLDQFTSLLYLWHWLDMVKFVFNKHI